MARLQSTPAGEWGDGALTKHACRGGRGWRAYKARLQGRAGMARLQSTPAGEGGDGALTKHACRGGRGWRAYKARLQGRAGMARLQSTPAKGIRGARLKSTPAVIGAVEGRA